MQETVDMVDDPEYEEEEPSFSDPEDFIDDVEDEGERQKEIRRLFGLLLTTALTVSRHRAAALLQMIQRCRYQLKRTFNVKIYQL